MLRKLPILLAFMLLCAVPVLAQDDDVFSLTIMHTNDVHATYDPDRDDRGGTARQATVVQQVRAEAEHTLLLDSGDRFTGSMFHAYYQGEDSARVMNYLGYDGMVLGSYEFTHGPVVLANFVTMLDFPAVVANVDFSQSDELADRVGAYHVYDFDGEQVGVVGVTQGDSRIRPIPELVFDTDYVGVVQAAVDELAAMGVNKVVLLSHLGYFTDLSLATQLDGVDVIVGGDSNTLLSNEMDEAEGPYPAVMESASGDPVLIVQAWERGRVLGRLDVSFDAAGVLLNWDGDAVLLDGNIEPDADAAALIEELREPLPDFLNQVVGETETDLDGERESCRAVECNMGDLVTDALRVASEAQVALHNGGAIRSSIATGEITVGDILAVLPFNNTLVIFELSGADLITALENSVSRVGAAEGNGRFLQVSGLRFSWDGSQAVGRRIVNVEVLNERGEYETLDPDEVYTVAANDYLLAGGDDYDVFAEKGSDPYDFGRTLDEIVRNYVAENSPVSLPISEGRITRIDR